MDHIISELARDDRGFLDSIEDVQELHQLLDALVARRKAAGLTQTDVARRMGVTQPTVSALESEDSNPRVESIQRYARAIGVRIRMKVERPGLPVSWLDLPSAGWKGRSTNVVRPPRVPA